MDVDLWKLYRMVLKLRRVEERVKSLWEAGLISGEMHLGTGEEAVNGERRGDGVRFVPGDKIGKDMAGTGGRLPAAGAPAAIDVKTIDRGL